LLYAQDWRIYLARGALKFITSDSPVVEWSGQSCSPFEAKTFLQRSHYLALTPEILLELTCPSGSISKVKRRTLYADQDDTVKKYNFLIAAHVFQYAYAGDTHSIEELLDALRGPRRE